MACLIQCVFQIKKRFESKRAQHSYGKKIMFAQMFLSVACVINLKDSKILYCSYSYTLRMQNNKAVLKTYLKSISIRYLFSWKAKSYFVLGFFVVFFLLFFLLFLNRVQNELV